MQITGKSTRVLPKMSEDALPPLYALTYAVCNIIRPTFLFDQTPEVLEIIAQIELIRQQATKYASQALVWNKYYAKELAEQAQDGILLDNHEVRIVSRLVERDRSFRIIYCGIINNCMRLHILHIWTGEKSHHLMRYLKLYFPTFSLTDVPHPRQIYHQNLSEDEEENFYATALKCIQFIHDAAQWEEKIRDQDSEAIVLPEDYQSDDFRQLRDSLMEGLNEDTVTTMIGDYVRYVENFVAKFEDIFPGATVLISGYRKNMTLRVIRVVLLPFNRVSHLGRVYYVLYHPPS
ncbi:hypothetical protein EW146_g7049 [Bondarzewia mesenterica]|uniref:Uncharacterized protein n=1 Tax=Bondarzewia mesenterica TaxID=1095465 RepID=A0A4S4LM11_9AGAM|nr:hypothetical protein EW146_g7049 [Bondarzewia mesenterica]